MVMMRRPRPGHSRRRAGRARRCLPAHSCSLRRRFPVRRCFRLRPRFRRRRYFRPNRHFRRYRHLRCHRRCRPHHCRRLGRRRPCRPSPKMRSMQHHLSTDRNARVQSPVHKPRGQRSPIGRVAWGEQIPASFRVRPTVSDRRWPTIISNLLVSSNDRRLTLTTPIYQLGLLSGRTPLPIRYVRTMSTMGVSG